MNGNWTYLRVTDFTGQTKNWSSFYKWQFIDSFNLFYSKQGEPVKKKRKGLQLVKNKLSFDFDEEIQNEEESSTSSEPPSKKIRTQDSNDSNGHTSLKPDQTENTKEEKSEDSEKSESKSESKSQKSKNDNSANFVDFSKVKIRKDPTVDTSFLPGKSGKTSFQFIERIPLHFYFLLWYALNR
jgi:hypothetical protein